MKQSLLTLGSLTSALSHSLWLGAAWPARLLCRISNKVFSGPLGRNLNFFLEAMGELLEISEQAGNMLKKYFRKIYSPGSHLWVGDDNALTLGLWWPEGEMM